MSDEPLTLCRHIPKVRRKSLKFFIDRLALRYSGARAIPIDGRLTPFAIGNLAKRARPSFSLKLAKMSCNQARDAQGFWRAQQAAFNLQHLGHSAWRERHLAQKLAEKNKTE